MSACESKKAPKPIKPKQELEALEDEPPARRAPMLALPAPPPAPRKARPRVEPEPSSSSDDDDDKDDSGSDSDDSAESTGGVAGSKEEVQKIADAIAKLSERARKKLKKLIEE